jgi:protein-disulfide isomerase
MTKGDVTFMRPVSEIDHIIGNPSAPVILVEYADIDSPFAKKFQGTMEQIMTEYAAGGKVAWVYRHLPLIDQHPNAETHAEAAECVHSIGGDTTFWRFIGNAQAKAPGNTELSPNSYVGIVSALGINTESFSECMRSHTYEQKVASDFANGLATGALGSPFSILVVKGQKPTSIDGAVSYEDMKRILDDAIAKVPEG